MVTYVIEIRDAKDGVLSYDLRDILSAIGNWGNDYLWHVDFIEPAIIKPGVVDMDKEIHYSSDFSRHHIEFSELVVLSSIFIQICNCRIWGQHKHTPEIISISAIDTSLWEIECARHEITATIKNHFADVKVTTKPRHATNRKHMALTYTPPAGSTLDR